MVDEPRPMVKCRNCGKYIRVQGKCQFCGPGPSVGAPAYRLAIAAVVVVAGLGWWAWSASQGGSDDRPGSPLVYERIEQETSCASLQQEFDRAAATNESASSSAEREWSLAYMQAADDRMSELGCY